MATILWNEKRQILVTEISFIGYSAGGLINRYCIGLLYERGVFQKVRPLHFITVATPHLGIRVTTRTFTGVCLNGMIDALCFLYAGRTGTQMALKDGNQSKPPLLLTLSNPNTVFGRALSLFPYIYFYANVNNDNTVPYCTASLSYTNKYRRMNDVERQASSTLIGYDHVLIVEAVSHTLDDAVLAELRSMPKKLDISIWNILYGCVCFIFIAIPILCIQLLLIIPLRCISLAYTPSSIPTTPSSADTGKIVSEQKDTAATLSTLDALDSPSTSLPSHSKELLPWIILDTLIKYHIYRVNVFIPAHHTHGLIINRRAGLRSAGGDEVIKHIVTEVLSKSTAHDAKEINLQINESIENDKQH